MHWLHLISKLSDLFLHIYNILILNQTRHSQVWFCWPPVLSLNTTLQNSTGKLGLLYCTNDVMVVFCIINEGGPRTCSNKPVSHLLFPNVWFPSSRPEHCSSLPTFTSTPEIISPNGCQDPPHHDGCLHDIFSLHGNGNCWKERPHHQQQCAKWNIVLGCTVCARWPSMLNVSVIFAQIFAIRNFQTVSAWFWRWAAAG